MKEKIVIAGTGRMALNIGDYFIGRGHAVTWVTENEGQHEKVLNRIKKSRRHLQKHFPEDLLTFKAKCRLLGATEISDTDIVIESTSEILEKKIHVLSKLAEQVGKSAIYCSNSSSFLPETLGPDCLGMHFFYPVSLSPCVELIVPKHFDEYKKEKILCFLKNNDLNVIIENNISAFAVNRLLLPLQSQCFKALKDGFSVEQVNRASRSPLLPMGQLTMMDSIGLDILFAAVSRYRNMQIFGEVDFDLILLCLGDLIRQGKLGKKNKNGLLLGEKWSWSEKNKDEEQTERLNLDLTQNLIEGCRHLCDVGLLTIPQLKRACELIYHCDSFNDILEFD